MSNPMMRKPPSTPKAIPALAPALVPVSESLTAPVSVVALGVEAVAGSDGVSVSATEDDAETFPVALARTEPTELLSPGRWIAVGTLDSSELEGTASALALASVELGLGGLDSAGGGGALVG